ncbi:UBX domain-containing protein 1 [Halyomorpha halys]|uniref:UBX domain-containing protein 1 n=1 Tax=Halyomorpha halys TaxID=286706 RepID=UPI0006D5024B|nr:UBX domain-containing protein 1 [Halyomorpha halys]
MSSESATVLMDMGFSKDQVERALQVTGNQGVEPAMEWLLAHSDDLNQSSGAAVNSAPTTSSSEDTSKSNETGDSPPSEVEAKSFKCNDCNKLFKDQGEVEFHAAKSGHTNFAESTEEKKALTEEEKLAQKRLLEQKLLEKRREREKREENEALEREKNRIRAGKEMVEIKKKLQDEELRKAIEQRKKEKEEDMKARQRIKDQIEADRQARREKMLQQQGVETPPPPPVVIPEVAKPAAKKDYTETRIQIRLLNGESLTQTFGIKEQLSAVRLYIELNRTDGDGGFSLMTTFPRKVFVEDDYDKPLDVLGLVPSAVIIVTKSPCS